MATSFSARQSRSHRIPACDRCRRRKLRCTVDIERQPCRHCRAQGTACHRLDVHIFASNQADSETHISESIISPHASESRPNSVKKLQLVLDPSLAPNSHQNVPVVRDDSRFVFSPTQLSDSGRCLPAHDAASMAGHDDAQFPMIVGPDVTEDVQMIEQHQNSESQKHLSTLSGQYNFVSQDPKKPVIYTPVPQRRKGFNLDSSPGKLQREILDQVLRPFGKHVIDLYFNHIHPAFPILDEQKFLKLYQSNDEALSHTLICEVYSLSLIFWDLSDLLHPHCCPDIRFAWNQAVAALQDDFLAPSISTVCSVLLSLSGRPTSSITGNSINLGRAVALSHTLGLNRHSTNWKIPLEEQHLRHRLWWGVLIHDRWSSLAHGVPFQIIHDHYDVPLPIRETLATVGKDSQDRSRASDCFIALCALTEILGHILPLLYCLRSRGDKEILRKLRHAETSLDDWEESLPPYLNVAGREDSHPILGLSNLRLAFLAIKMLLCRISLRLSTAMATTNTQQASSMTDLGCPETRQYHLAMLRNAAHAIVTFICSLQPQDLHGFWLPQTAYNLTSTAILLLRCAIEKTNDQFEESCKSSLRLFQNRLRRARDKDNWDLADICLAQCEESISRVLDPSRSDKSVTAPLNATSEPIDAMARTQFDEVDYMNSATSMQVFPMNCDPKNIFQDLEFPWTNLFDMTEPSLIYET